jgi:hypothetical protein
LQITGRNAQPQGSGACNTLVTGLEQAVVVEYSDIKLKIKQDGDLDIYA